MKNGARAPFFILLRLISPDPDRRRAQAKFFGQG